MRFKPTLSSFSLSCVLLAIPSLSFGAFELSGTALQDADNLVANDTAVFLVSNDGTPFSSLTSLDAGLSLTDTATYGSSFSVFTNSATNTTADTFGSVSLGSGTDTELGVDGITVGDTFGIVVFASSSTSTINGDTFWVYTGADWTVASDGLYDFTGDYTTFGGAEEATGTVVPEPSSYALLAGFLGLAMVMVRRRK